MLIVEERYLMDLIGVLLCVVCKKMGVINYNVCLYYIDGRIKFFVYVKSLFFCVLYYDMLLMLEECVIYGDVFFVYVKGLYGGKKVFEVIYGI